MILLLVFTVVVLVQLYFYHFLFGKLANYKPDLNLKSTDLDPVSVVICARNESENLKKNIPLIARQKYPEFEIVLVNDASTDASLQTMRELKSRFESLSDRVSIKILNLPKTGASGNKKKALSQGIKKATYSNLLLTDADCAPVSDDWIRLMTSGLNRKKEIVLGYGPYKTIKTSFLNKLIRFETLITAMQYFSYALSGKPYMGVGRNLAYKKSLFLSSKGFEKHKDIRSGDDDLFVQEHAHSGNTLVCIDQKAFSLSEPKKTFADWFRQKRRHVSAASHYRPGHKFSLALFYLSQLSFWLLAIVLFFTTQFIQVVVFLAGIRFLVWYAAVMPAAKKLNEHGLLLFAPVLEIALISSQLFIFIANLISTPKKW